MSEATQDDILAAALSAATEVKVVGGQPNDDEVAALVASLVAVASAQPDDEADDAAPQNQWTNHQRRLEPRTPTRGRDAWRWSLRA
ncbi:acyl-CoA carboxylase subunit epsilon [Timonella sp. A28]|uniref:acyl-CoA carboxylase subunit epsilon n=1 Tax=Timonella sp. A28 TaxID=3442640 RepID=UPI003EB9A0AD